MANGDGDDSNTTSILRFSASLPPLTFGFRPFTIRFYNIVAGAAFMAAHPSYFLVLFITHSSLGLEAIVGSDIFKKLIIYVSFLQAMET